MGAEIENAPIAAEATDQEPFSSGPLFNRVLDPLERLSEILFGLIMVLTFTGSIRAATADQASIRAMLIGALGSNIAWGIIDGGMYLMACLHERGRKLLTLRAVRDEADSHRARTMIADALPPLLVPLLPHDQFQLLHRKLRQLPEPPAFAALERSDWVGAVGVFLLVFLSMVPVVVPFVLIEDAKLASWTSNAVAVTMLFFCGYAFGRCAGFRPWPVGFAMVGIGVALVALTIALGG